MSAEKLQAENAELLRRLKEAEATIRALRDGDADFLRVERPESNRSEQVRQLADVAMRLNAMHDVQSIVGIVTEEARSLIGAHQAVVSFTSDQQWAQSNLAVSLSDKYAQWRTYDRLPDGSGIYSLVTRNNQPMRMTQAELEAHPAWKGFGEHAAEHPPMRGWLAVPFRGQWHGNVGLIQLSDRFEGEFTADDEAVMVQLAQMTAVAIDNSRLVEDLRESDRRKTEFLAMLAHELRNPLAPIRNSVQILRLHEGSEPIRAAAEMLERQVGQMVHLVDDLLDVSRISRGKIELRRGRVELAPIVHQALEAARPLCESAGHELAISLPNEPIHLRADPIRLAQVISNLLSNACKFTNAGGKISLTVERAEGEAVIQVQDNGIGIAPDELSHIFDMFQQVDTSLERSVSGLGIGLTLVKTLVELHGGKVSANSGGSDKGSTFTVRLPIVASDSRPTTIPPSRPSQPVSAGLRILIVDDNRDAATSLAMLLKMKGHKTHVAYDGVEAVDAAEAFRPQVAILDIGLPKLNGYDVCRRIREQPPGGQMAIFALTGCGQEEDRQKSKAAGFTGHLVKPVDFAALLKLIGETASKSD